MSDSRFHTPGSLLRYMCVVASLLLAVIGCSHQLPDYVSKYTTPPPEPPALAVAVAGDAMTGGASSGTLAWPALAAAQLRQQNINVDLQIAAGSAPRGNEDAPLAKQVQQVVRPTTKVVVLFGDVESTAAENSSAVKRALAEVKKAAPGAKLLVIGPAWTNGRPPATVLTVREALKVNADAAGATFVDPIADGWFANRPDLISGDHQTPTDAGHAYLAGKIAPLIAQQLQPLPAGPVGAPR